MSEKTVAEKMRIKPGARVALIHAPEQMKRGLGLPAGADFVDSASEADVVLLFATTQTEYAERVEALQPKLARTAVLWVCYPKGSKAAGLDISRDTIWAHAEARGWRPVGLVSIDDTWSGFRLKLSS
jgi:hypothetical protein